MYVYNLDVILLNLIPLFKLSFDSWRKMKVQGNLYTIKVSDGDIIIKKKKNEVNSLEEEEEGEVEGQKT